MGFIEKSVIFACILKYMLVMCEMVAESIMLESYRGDATIAP